MLARCSLLSLAAVSFTALGLAMVPLSAAAQEKNDDAGKADTGLPEKPIDLDVEGATLYDALSLLFQNAHANFLLDSSLKQSVVNAHFHQIPLRTALDILIKSSGRPLTYRFENNVYSVLPRVETPPAPVPLNVAPEPAETSPARHRTYKIRSSELVYNAIDIVTWLGGTILNSQVPAGLTGVGNGFGGGGLGGGGNGAFGSGSGGFGGGLQGGQGVGGFGGGLGGFGSGLGAGQNGFTGGNSGSNAGSGGPGGAGSGRTGGIASGLLPEGVGPGNIYALAADNSIIIHFDDASDP